MACAQNDVCGSLFYITKAYIPQKTVFAHVVNTSAISAACLEAKVTKPWILRCWLGINLGFKKRFSTSFPLHKALRLMWSNQVFRKSRCRIAIIK